MTLQRWGPLSEMVTLSNAMDRLFEDSVVLPSVFLKANEGGILPLDVLQGKNEVVVKASLPGFKPEEVEISLVGDTLTIKGDHKEEEETKEGEYWLKERRYGTFSRILTLPVEVKGEKAEAAFDNGVLTLTLPKIEEVKPRQIKVKPAKQIESTKKSESKK
jgi:HSP20 family protein